MKDMDNIYIKQIDSKEIRKTRHKAEPFLFLVCVIITVSLFTVTLVSLNVFISALNAEIISNLGNFENIAEALEFLAAEHEIVIVCRTA